MVEAQLFVMAGGAGKRLSPLTRDRAKPAVPMGGNYRIIDWVLSNAFNSGINNIKVAIQYKPISLHNHLTQGWVPKFRAGGLEALNSSPREGGLEGYVGTADSLIQNLPRLRCPQNASRLDRGTSKAGVIDVFGGDHVYLIDIREINNYHLNQDAHLTISAIPVSVELAAKNYGVLVVDENYRLIGFEEKPENPTPIPGNPNICLASMGNYVFNPETLYNILSEDGEKEFTRDRNLIAKNRKKYSSHDFGFDIIPWMLENNYEIFVYNFNNNIVPGAEEKERGFWRDVGDLDQFYAANKDLIGIIPVLNIYNSEWPIHSWSPFTQPAKFVGSSNGSNPFIVSDSLVGNSSIISYSEVNGSIIGPNVYIDKATVKDSILLGNSRVNPKSHIENSIIDKGVIVPEGISIGVDKQKDKERGFTISPKDITVVPRDYKFE
ncbi:MAG: sugar phosphate nucleotidyltransferase [Candidatus Nanoarchaeia archaeon]|nr:sugar phosphate nucleotidyltransferase [Candidatus Nanoarchaeia archaeon]